MANFLTTNSITWTFDKEVTLSGAGGTYQYGTYCNGDYWIIGPVTIINMDPSWNGIYNGAELNTIASGWPQGLVTNAEWAGYSSTLNVAIGLPRVFQPNSSVLSSRGNGNCTDVYEGDRTFITGAAVLTVLSTPPTANSFRPGYAGTTKTHMGVEVDIRYDRLARVASVTGEPLLSTSVTQFGDVRPMHLAHQAGPNILPCGQGATGYGADNGGQLGTAILLANCDYTAVEKRNLVISLCQFGIDVYEVITHQAPGGLCWVPNGGHGSFLKLAIIFAGIILDNAEMMAIGTKSGDYLYDGAYGEGNHPPDYYHFAEDDQCFYVKQSDVDRGKYEVGDIDLPEWGIRHGTTPSMDDASWYADYRRQGTANSWGAGLLAIHMMATQGINAKGLWNHPVMFDYMDRFQNIEGGSFARHANPTWVGLMWDTYREAYPPIWPDESAYDTTPPLPPTSLISPQQSDTTINLSWTAGAQAADGDYPVGYNIYRDVVFINAVTGTTYTDTGLIADTSYDYDIYSYDDAGNESASAASNTYTTETAAPPITKVFINGAGDDSNDGSDWLNARRYLPAALVRGITYYIGTGDFGTYTFDDAAHSTVITIQKATLANHGTEDGWNPAYAGLAQWGNLTFDTTSHIDFLGVSPGQTLIQHSGATPLGAVIEIDTCFNIRIDYCDVNGMNGGMGNLACTAVNMNNISYVWIEHCSLHEIADDIIQCYIGSELYIRWNRMYNAYGIPCLAGNGHSDAMELGSIDDSEIIGNFVYGIHSNSCLFTDNWSGNFCNRLLIANNIFYNNEANVYFTVYLSNTRYVKFYNNIIWGSYNGTVTSDSGVAIEETNTNLDFRNNICNGIVTRNSGEWDVTNTGDYNIIYNSPQGYITGSNDIIGTDPKFTNTPVSGTPLPNPSINDFAPLNETAPSVDSGTAITEASYDILHNNRPTGVAYDIGAFEYSGSVLTTGACCNTATGECTITTEAQCPFNWLGAGTTCADCYVSLPTEGLVVSYPCDEGSGYTANDASGNNADGYLINASSAEYEDGATIFTDTGEVHLTDMHDGVEFSTVNSIVTKFSGDLVAYWPLDDNAANTHVDDATDTALHDGVATANTDVLHDTGKIGDGCFNMDGQYAIEINDHSNFSFNDTADENMSITAWIFYTNTGIRQVILSKEDTSNKEWSFVVDPTGELRFRAFDESAGKTAEIVADDSLNLGWNFVAVTYESSHASWSAAAAADFIKLYVNANLVDTTSTTADGYLGMENLTAKVAIGATKSSGNFLQFFNNKIDDVAVFNKKLSVEDINTIYGEGTGLGHMEPGHGTIAAAIYPTTVTGRDYYVFGHTIGIWSHRIQIYIKDGYLHLGMGLSHTTAANIKAVSVDTWYHVILTWQDDGIVIENGVVTGNVTGSGTWVLYVDGIAEAGGVYTSLQSLDSTARFGNTGYALEPNNEEAFEGYMDNLRIYDIPLPASNCAGLAFNDRKDIPPGPPEIDPPIVINITASNITANSVVLGGEITDTGGEIPNVTLYYGDNDGGTTPGSWDDSIDMGAVLSTFNISIGQLTHNTTYFFRCYAENSGGSDWADSTAQFDTLEITAPTLTQDAASNIAVTTVTLSGDITDDGNETPTVTIYYGDNDGVTTPGNWDDFVVVVQDAEGAFSANITGLTADTLHYFRIYAENSTGGTWGSTSLQFTTDPIGAPTVINLPATDIEAYAGRIHGEVTDAGAENPTVAVYWGTSDGGAIPGNWDNAASFGVQTGTFNVLLVGLSLATIYYYRAYATNSYGNDWADSTQSFSTLLVEPISPDPNDKPDGFVWGNYDNAYEIVSPYANEEIFDVHRVSRGDVTYLAHSYHSPQKLTRYADKNWVLEEIDIIGGPFLLENEDADITLQYVNGTGSTTGNYYNVDNTGTINCSGDTPFLEEMVGSLFLLKHTRHDNTVESADNHTHATPTGSGVRVHGDWQFDVSNMLDGDNPNHTAKIWRRALPGEWQEFQPFSASTLASGTEKEKDVFYTWTDDSSDVAGTFTAEAQINKGIVKITSFISTSSVAVIIKEQVYQESSTSPVTSMWAEGAWNDYRGFPKTVTYFGNRLWWAGTTNNPQGLWGSRIGYYEDHTGGVADDDAVAITISDNDVSSIEWITASQNFMVGSARKEYIISAVDRNDPITPSDNRAKPHSTNGSMSIQPVELEGGMLYAQRLGYKMMLLYYQYLDDAYDSLDANRLTPHMFKYPAVDMARQGTPETVVWVTRTDGTLAIFRYSKAEEITSWARVVTGSTADVAAHAFISTSVVAGTTEDRIWTIVERIIEGRTYYYVERFANRNYDKLADAMYLDCAATVTTDSQGVLNRLYYLENYTVTVMDGFTKIGDYLISGGQITGLTPATEYIIGLPYICRMRTMAFAVPSIVTEGNIKRVLNILVRTVRTRGGSAGATSHGQTNIVDLDIDYSLDAADIEVFSESGFTKESRLVLDFSDPYPATILAIVFEVEI